MIIIIIVHKPISMKLLDIVSKRLAKSKITIITILDK